MRGVIRNQIQRHPLCEEFMSDFEVSYNVEFVNSVANDNVKIVPATDGGLSVTHACAQQFDSSGRQKCSSARSQSDARDFATCVGDRDRRAEMRRSSALRRA
jgi:hypothetical protein